MIKNLVLSTFMTFHATTAQGQCRVSPEGIELIKKFEGFAPKAYIDSGGGWWAIGYGSNGYGIKRGTVWTEQQAHNRLRRDLHLIGMDLCRKLRAKGVEFNVNQFNALLSLAYNAGIGAATNRTLLNYINKGKVVRASNRILLYVKVRGKVSSGLVRRRNAERNLFLTRDQGDMYSR